MEENPTHQNYCTFPFAPDLTVRLTGNFLDRVSQAVRTIRDALKYSDWQTRRNGEGLIAFMQSIIK